jgi:hypothetical protein
MSLEYLKMFRCAKYFNIKYSMWSTTGSKNIDFFEEKFPKKKYSASKCILSVTMTKGNNAHNYYGRE